MRRVIGRRVIGPDDMRRVEAVDQQSGLVVDRQAERSANDQHAVAAKELFGGVEQRIERGRVVDRVDETEKAAGVVELPDMRGLDRRDDPADRLAVPERDERLHDVLAAERRPAWAEDHPDLGVERLDPARIRRLRAATRGDEGRNPRMIVDRNDLNRAHAGSARRTSAAGEVAPSAANSSATTASASGQILRRMLAAEKEPQAGEAFRDGRGDDRLDIDAPLEQSLTQRDGADRIPGHHRHDRLSDARADVEPGAPASRGEGLRIFAQAAHALGLPMQDFESGERGGGDRRRHADAVDESAGRVFQVVDERRRARDIPAAGGERLRQRPHPDVDPARIDAEMLENAVPARAQDAEIVGRVDHQPGLSPFLEGDEPGKIAKVAVHAVEAFGDDQDALVAIADRFQQRIERGEVVVREGSAFRARQMRAGDNAVVGERVVNDEVARTDEGADRRHVRRVPADESQAGVLPVVPGERRLERPMHRPFAGHEPAR